MESSLQIPPPGYMQGRKPKYPPIIETMKPGDYRAFNNVNQQCAFWKAAKKMGRDPVYRKIAGEYRVYLRG